MKPGKPKAEKNFWKIDLKGQLQRKGRAAVIQVNEQEKGERGREKKPQPQTV